MERGAGFRAGESEGSWSLGVGASGGELLGASCAEGEEGPEKMRGPFKTPMPA